ncbi:MAG: transporter substrate-binding domain-containing protein [Clostridia bacterium]|nr:transporter substrate-binding domain-containing protein [Clostridia bacterium]
MKKSLILVMLVVAIIATAAFGFMACNKKADVVKVIDIKITDEEYAFCVNKADTELLASVNEYIATIKSNGTFDAIVNKYFGDGTPTPVESAPAGTANALVVATNAAFEPFEYLDGNKFLGVDMEIAKGLADYLNKPLVIKNIEFDSIFSEINAGTASIGMAGITVNESRKELVQFTSSYYNASQVVVVKADDTTFDACKTAEDVEAILNTLTADKKIGVQRGTTGNFYVVGDVDWDFPGLKATCKEYSSAALAIQDMNNGNIDYVIVDEAPAKKITEKMNKLA